MLPHLAFAALAAAALAAWRVSRPISLALAAAALSSGAYALLAVVYPDAHARGALEAQRWVSALVGLVGAAVLARPRLYRPASVIRVFGWGAIWKTPLTADALALLCLASMVSDGAAQLFWRARWPWVGDAATLVFCGAAVAVCRPWRKA